METNKSQLLVEMAEKMGIPVQVVVFEEGWDEGASTLAIMSDAVPPIIVHGDYPINVMGNFEGWTEADIVTFLALPENT